MGYTTRNYTLVATEKYWPEFAQGEWKEVAIFSDKAKSILLNHMRERGAARWEICMVIDEYDYLDRLYETIMNEQQLGV